MIWRRSLVGCWSKTDSCRQRIGAVRGRLRPPFLFPACAIRPLGSPRRRSAATTSAPKASQMNTVVTKEDVEAFAQSCVLLRSMWWHYHTLFEVSKLRRELLAAVAPTFFSDVCAMLREHLVLHICRLTDNEQTMGRKNLTVKWLMAHADFSAEPAKVERLRHLSDSINDFRKTILPARNRFISHVDLEAVRAGQPLGGASQEQWQQFWLVLQDFLQIIHQRYVDASGYFYLNGIAMLTDTDALVGALVNSERFRTVISDGEVATRALRISDACKFAGA
jgi:AbiU2